ncbi:hypothetical protein BSKO_01645 [Bryopsis sp. KO-2023]|nr:hypothetical protein BSKO_01645 [Bryopsis sp. KO-2023]
MASNDGNKAKALVQTNTPSSCPFFSQPIFDPMEVDSPPARVVRRTGLKRKSVVERSSGGYDRVAVREVKRAKRNPRPSETRLSAPMWHFVQVLTGLYAGEDPYKVREERKISDPGVRQSEIAKAGGERWRAMSEEERPYEKLSSNAKATYKEKAKKYKKYKIFKRAQQLPGSTRTEGAGAGADAGMEGVGAVPQRAKSPIRFSEKWPVSKKRKPTKRPRSKSY